MSEMNEKIEGLVSFIEETERQLQVRQIMTDIPKSDVVKQILDELERVTKDED